MKQKHGIHLFRLLAALLVAAMLALPGRPALSADTGEPRNPGAAANISHFLSEVLWVSPVNILEAGAPYASASFPNNERETFYLQATQYGFAIPPGSTIQGIQVTVNRRASQAGVRDYAVRLVKGGSPQAGNRARQEEDWPTSFTAATYGSPTDLWGTTWTPAEINAARFGAALTIYNHTTLNPTAYVDTIQIQVFYTPPPATTTRVDCGETMVVYGSSLTCTATVTRLEGTNTPAGTVSWATDGSGTFTPGACTLSGTGGSVSCSVTYTPAAVGEGVHRITATYPSSANFTGSSGGQDIYVQKARPVLQVVNPHVIYNRQPQAAVVETPVEGTISNIRYNGRAEIPVTIGAYSVAADFVPADPGNYQSLSGAYAGILVIDTRPITVTADAKTKTYGDADPALTYQVTSGNLAEGDAFMGALSRARGENAGTYAIERGSLALSYNYSLSYVGANLTITQVIPTLSVLNPATTYNGSPQSAMVVSSAPGITGNVRYNGKTELPVDAGVYAVTADFTPWDTVNFASLSGAPAGSFVITPHTIYVALDFKTKGYGEPDPELTFQFDPDPLVSRADFTGAPDREPGEDVGFYSIRQGSLALPANFDLRILYANLQITQATPTLTISNPRVTYTGEPQAAVISSPILEAVVNVRYDGQATLPVDAGVYAVTADFVSPTFNYASLWNVAVGNFEIQKATPALSVSNPPVTYDGQPHEAVVTGSIPGEVVKVYYDGVETAPVNAGTYAVTADFIPTDSSNYETLTQAAAGSLVIEKAAPALSVSNSPLFYDGQPQAAVVIGSVAGAVSHVLYDGEETLPVAPGAYAVSADFDSADPNYTSLSDAPAGTFIILAAGPALDLEKTAAEETFSYTGAAIHYSYRLTNTGDVPLAGPFSVTDDRISVSCLDESSLAVAAALTCTGSDTVTHEDLRAGKVTNTATAYASYAGEEIISNPVEATVTYKPANLYFPWIFRMLQDP